MLPASPGCRPRAPDGAFRALTRCGPRSAALRVGAALLTRLGDAGPPRPRQLLYDEAVRRADERLELGPLERFAERLLLHPHVARHVRRRDDALPFDELAKGVRRALEGRLVRRLEVDDDEHLAADEEAEIGSPLHVFGDAGQGSADAAQAFDRHRSANSPLFVP